MALLHAAPAYAAEARVALVIGNGAYSETTRLANPSHDAEDVAAALEGVGFEVIRVIDGDKLTMERAVRSFGNRLAGAEVALFFYAGHGLQVAGRNYLLPVNARLVEEQDLLFEAIDAALPLSLMEQAGARVKLVVLDACRDNPLARSLARSIRSTGRSTEVGRGLARIEGAVGTLIAYATAPGDIAADGRDRNSPFTTGLLRWIAQPGLEVRAMFGRVREAVHAATNGRQVPWVNESLMGEFYFQPRPVIAASPAPAVAAVAPAVPTAPSAPRAATAEREALFWKSIQESTRPEDFEEYLRQFPRGTFAGLARRRAEALRQEQASLPAPPPASEGDLEPVEAIYVTLKNANVREAPTVRSAMVATLARGTQVHVAGRLKGRNWYLVERGGEPLGYVYGDLLMAADKARVALAVPPPPTRPDPAPPALPTASWAGTWKTNYGLLEIRVEGRRMTGIYPYNEGRLEGRISPDGRTIEGRWGEAPSYRPPQRAGAFAFSLSADGRSFTGGWWSGYENVGNPNQWDGVRTR
jgi:uncharacterized caspase-like protein